MNQHRERRYSALERILLVKYVCLWHSGDLHFLAMAYRKYYKEDYVECRIIKIKQDIEPQGGTERQGDKL
jgi:hypothetical protein